MDFAGEGDLSVFVDDLYIDKNIEANLYIEDFTINEDSFGTLELDLSKDNKEPASMLMSLSNEEHELLVDAAFDPDNDNYLDATVQAKKFPLQIFQYLLRDGIKDTYGGVDLRAELKGPASDIKIEGKGYLNGRGCDYIYRS